MKKSELKQIIREELKHINEDIDIRSFEISINNIKNDLDAATDFFKTGQMMRDIDKVEEYLNDSITAIKRLLTKLS